MKNIDKLFVAGSVATAVAVCFKDSDFTTSLLRKGFDFIDPYGLKILNYFQGPAQNFGQTDLVNYLLRTTDVSNYSTEMSLITTGCIAAGIIFTSIALPKLYELYQLRRKN